MTDDAQGKMDQTSDPPAPARRGVSRRKALLGGAVLGGAALAGGGSVLNTVRADSAEARFPPLGDFETVDGVRIHLLDSGPRDLTPLVLIHGASGNLRDFGFGFTDRFRDRYRVIAVDRPGHGHSERGGGDAHRPDRQAFLLREAVARRGARRAVVLGHSLGAAIALAWALDAPETVIGVVNLAGAAMPWPGGIDLQYRLADTPVLGRLAANAVSALVSESYVHEQIAGIFAPQAPPAGYLQGVGAPLALRPRTFRHNGQDVKNLKPFLAEMSQRYPGFGPPLEILHGSADTIVPARTHAEPLAKLAPRARLSLLSGMGHMPHHAAGDLVAAAVDRVATA